MFKFIKRKDDDKVNMWWLLLTIVVAFFIIALIITSLIIVFEIKYQNKFFPGSRIGNIRLEGLTTIEALDTLYKETEDIKKNGFQIICDNEEKTTATITSSINALNDPDLSVEIFDFDNHQTIYQAFDIGRNKSWWENLINQYQLFFDNKSFPVVFELNEGFLLDNLKQKFQTVEINSANAMPVITWSGEKYEIEISEEKTGLSINYDQAINQLKNNLAYLNNEPIFIHQQKTLPTITKFETINKTNLISSILNTSTPEIIYQSNSWEINKQDLSKILEFQKSSSSEILVGINLELFSIWLEENIAPSVDIEPKNAEIEMKNGRVSRLSPHREGQKINMEETYQKINSNLLANIYQTELVVETISPEIKTADINSMGIEKIIGTGQSNFSGSPVNRRHNIQNGANSLNGILIKPDEEFSLIQALGDIDASSGYLPELVIKDNKTIPEYGGGLCQIGTTIFRTAMASGLPITERRNHSYNVSYYLENGLPGTDATIYQPHPDVRFVNDTGNYILVQSRINGNDLYFDFWGTSDGRIASRTKPNVWGWTNPLPTKYVETTDLEPGKTKCTESSHQGVSASFDYFVKYPDGREEKTTFSSYYKPWQAVCLVGIEEIPTETSTSTEEIIEE